jgi:hypothetical protein
MAKAKTFNIEDYEPYEPGEFIIEDIAANETGAPALVPGIMHVVAIGFVYIPEHNVTGSKQVTVKTFALEDNLAGNVSPVTDLKLAYDGGNYTGQMPIKNPFRVEQEFLMKVKLEADKKGVDGGFLRVIFYYDHKDAA